MQLFKAFVKYIPNRLITMHPFPVPARKWRIAWHPGPE